MEDKIAFSTGGLTLEGLLTKSSDDRGVVITHPHPLYGGNMHNNVVGAIAQAYQRRDYSTLRFNFRGVGGSQGSYGDGIGEQEDVRAAIAYLADLGLSQIDLAGYSFGAWVNGNLSCPGDGIANMVMVSPPVAFMDFGPVGELGCLKLIITGGRDDIAPAQMINQSYPQWNADARFEVIDGADHFYGGYEGRLADILTSNLPPKPERKNED